MKEQLSILDKVDGNIDSISNRIANVRTWSYVSNKNGWVENQDYWVKRTKFLEDKLSDRLHEELTKSFIDKRASVLARGLKQDISFETKIEDNEKVLINNQFIGNLKGLKLELDFKIGDLETDIKSLKKAARQNVSPEISKRINQIIEAKQIELRENRKIYWNNFPIAILTKGSDYLSPELNLIIDEIVENNEKYKLHSFLKKWLETKIINELDSLFKLKSINSVNSQIRALSYQLYENNGVVKREEVLDIMKNLSQEDRKTLRNLGVKFGRYHIFLFKLFKPSVVSLRILLWKNFNGEDYNLLPPTFGLNFVNNVKYKNRKFMLLCGFEKFDNFFVRIDILERLFIEIINSNENKSDKIKLLPKMLNLLGCNKESFIKIIKLMGYKVFEEKNETFFKYKPFKKIKKSLSFKIKKDNPFEVLKQLDLK
tara:strand:- start:249 stop:1532 length:1284 start_codon:yes stop_codon:yes gene_type:complete